MRGPFQRHPSEASLALFAGGDLGWFRSLLVSRHLPRCARCRSTVAAYARLRSTLAEKPSVPPIDYGALARRVRASAAAEGAASRPAPPWDWRWKASAGMAAIAAVCAFVLLAPRPADESAGDPAPVASGLAFPAQAPPALGLEDRESQVTSAGGLSFRSFEPETGMLTITLYFDR